MRLLVIACLTAICLSVVPATRAAEPTVTALELTELRQARFKQDKDAERQRFGGDVPGLTLVLEVRGADVARASAFGQLEIEGARDNAGKEIKLNEEALSYDDPRGKLVDIDRNQMFMGEDDPPKDLIRIALPFELPARAAESLTVRGKLQLQCIETIDVLVPATIGEAKHEKLDQLGLKVKVVKSEEASTFAFESSGKLKVLHDARVVGSDGKPVETNGYSAFGDDESMHRDVYLGEALPAGAQLKLTLVVKSESIPVKFELKDLKLP